MRTMIFQMIVENLAAPVDIEVVLRLEVLKPVFDSLKYRPDTCRDLLPEIPSGEDHAREQATQHPEEDLQRNHRLPGVDDLKASMNKL